MERKQNQENGSRKEEQEKNSLLSSREEGELEPKKKFEMKQKRLQ